MSKLAELSLANRALILLITLASLVFGLIAAGTAQREMIPSIENPSAIVGAQYQGASPRVVENDVTEPLEQAVKGVPGVTDHTSTSSTGTAQIVAEFDYGEETEDVVRSLQRSVDQVRPQLPEDVDPYVQAFGSDDIPVVMLAAGAGDGAEQRLADPVEEQVVPALEAIDGVRAVQVMGVRESTVTVIPDTEELEDNGLAVADLASALQASSVMSPGGDITDEGRTLTVTTGERLESLEDVEDVWLTPGGSGQSPQGAPQMSAGAAPGASADPVRLSDVADVELRRDEASSITRTNGDPSLGLMVTKTPEGNTVDISEAVHDEIGELEPILDEEAELSVVFDQAPFINDSITAMGEEGVLGLVFATLVILVFLLSVRSTLVTAVSIPVSLLIALLGMQVFDYSLNILTLGALTVSIGRVVDDSIVVLENIKRHMSYGEDKRTAVLTGVREVATAITSATLTTIAVFLPIAFVGGQTGELFRPFSVTVSVALAASLLVSLTIIPVLAYWFMRPRAVAPEDTERVRDEELRRELRTPLQRAYLPVIRWSTRWRRTTLLASVVILTGTLALAFTPYLKTSFLDDAEQNTFYATQELPVGSSLERIDAEAQKVESQLAELEWVESYQASIGGGQFGGMFGGGPATAQFTITTDPEGDQERFRDSLREMLADIDSEAETRLQSGGSVGGAMLEVEVRADSRETLEEAAERVETAVADIPGAADVENSLAADLPVLRVRVDGEAAAEEGISEGYVGQAVSEAFQGSDAGTATIDDARRDIVVRADAAPASVDELRELEIDAPSGETVELSEIAEVTEEKRAAELTRSGGARSATISASPTMDDLGAVTAELTTTLEELELPEGATAEIGGTSSEQTEAFTQMGVAMLAAIAIVYLVMVATFKSLVQPLILLVSIPFAATGALGLLVVTGIPLALPSLIGMLMLIGIVVTNAIVLIDLINQYRSDGMELDEAVVEGARHRLRPILMTSLATMCALVPMSLGITGGGVFISQPLAVVVIGGLFSSTLLTLVLVPVLYLMAESRKQRRARRRSERHEARLAEARVAQEQEA